MTWPSYTARFANKPEAYKRHTSETNARRRALARLAQTFPDTYAEFLAEERAQLGLPPHGKP